jgi:hypothetical protein
MATHTPRRILSLALGGLLGLIPAAFVAGTALAATPALAQNGAAAGAKKDQPAADKPVVGDKVNVILRSGQVLEGKLIENSATKVRLLVNVRGIQAESSYDKADILSVEKLAGDDTPAVDAAKTPDKGAAPAKADPAKAEGAGGPKVYVMELEGWFGEEISETPIRQAAADAKRNEVDYIIVVLNNDWSDRRSGGLDQIKDDAGAFDQIFRAEKMAPIFADEIPKWSKAPKVVFWVKKAMGGASLLPFCSNTIYYASEGKQGGIGHLTKIFGQMGDERVREKQFSLRLGHAEGWAIQGGYDPLIIDAMARDDVILSYKMEGGKAKLLSRMPEGPDEFLLTDDGKEDRADNIVQLARGEGNDVLTLNADLAYKLGISKGTVDTMDDLLFNLGLARNHQMVKGQSANIMKAWRDGLDNAKRRLEKLWDDFQNVQVKDPGGYNERTQARGKRKAIITEMENILKKYEEALDPREIPVPDYNTLEIYRKRIELEQLGDKQDKRP